MPLAYALTFFCDAMLYYGALGCLGLLRGCREALFRVPLLLLAGCWLSGRLAGRGRPWLRWLPVAVVLPCLFAAGNWQGRLLSLPMLAYLPLYVNDNRRAPDYDYAAERFRHSLIAAAAALLIAALVQARSWKRGLPYLFLYFTLNMALLRLLRHDDGVARSRRFRLINLAGVAAVCAAGFGLSQPGIVAALRAGLRWCLENIVLRVLALAAYLIHWALYLVVRAFALLFPFDSGLQDAALPYPGLSPVAPMIPQSAEEVRALPPAARFALRAAGFALLAGLTLLALRAVSRRAARIGTHGGTDVREPLDAPAPPAPRRPGPRRDPGGGVRRQYRRALQTVRARGGRVSPGMNTLQLLEENADVVDPEAFGELREVYLPVRYGEKPASPEALRRAREALERMRRNRPG